MLSFLPKVRIGDFIETQGKSGYVDEINLRNITIRQTDNEYVIIPNSVFIENPFTNYSWSHRSRVDVGCGVGYESNLTASGGFGSESDGRKIFSKNRMKESNFFLLNLAIAP